MSSPSQKRQGLAGERALNSSNSTSAYFAGNIQRSWMGNSSASSGQSPKAVKLQSFASPPQSTLADPASELGSPECQTISTDSHDVDDDIVSVPQLSPSLKDAQAATKRPRTDDEDDISSRPAVDGTNYSKRPRNEEPEESVEHPSEEVTATLPSPPNDRTSLGTHRLPSEITEISSRRKSPPAATDSNMDTAMEITPTQTRSPPLEVANTVISTDVPAATTSEELPSSLVDTALPREISSRIDVPLPSHSTGDLANRAQATTSEELPSSLVETALPRETSSRIEVPLPSPSTGDLANQAQVERRPINLFPVISSPYFQTLSKEVARRTGYILASRDPNPIDLARLRLLQQACSSGDRFFMALHRMYCGPEAQEKANKSISIRNGIHVLQRMLASNDSLSGGSVQWFTAFAKIWRSTDPKGLEAEKRVEEQVWRFLGAFAVPWGQLQSTYPPFKSPPSSYALSVHIPGLTSVVLQQVIFLANLRTSWVGPPDVCIDQCESIFNHEQQFMQALLKDRRPDDPSINPNLRWLDKIATQQFTKILTGHQAHGVEARNTANDVEHSHEPRRPSQNRPESTGFSPQLQQGATEMPTSRGFRPSLPNINTHSARSSVGAVSSPVPPAWPTSASLCDPRRPHHVLGSSPSTPTIATDRTMSLPNSGAQSIHTGTSLVPVMTTANDPRERFTQELSAMQAVPPSAVAPNPAFTPGQQEVRMQPPPQFGQTWPVAQRVSLSSFLPTQQFGQRPQVGFRQGFAGQQSAQWPTHSPEGQIQQISVARNPSASTPAAPRLPSMGQTIQTHPQQLYLNSGPLMHQPPANTHVVPHATNLIVPQSYFQAYGPAAPEVFREHVMRNGPAWRAAWLPQMLNSNAPASHQPHTTGPQSHTTGPQPNPPQVNVPHLHTKYFRYVQNVLFLGTLSSVTKHSLYREEYGSDLIDRLAKETVGPVGEPVKQIWVGSYVARIGCLKLKMSDPNPPLSDWTTADVSWPPSIKMNINGKVLEIRKKNKYAKDVAFDATSLLKVGQNEFTASVSGLPSRCDEKWLLGLELIWVLDAANIKRVVTTQTEAHCRKRILDKLRPKDLEIEVVEPQTVLDLTDPFTSRIFDTPVRGLYCRHNQCFDLDTFLETRRADAKYKEGENNVEVCTPEEFRCPICKDDVRPDAMVVDGFFVSIRSELKKKGRLDVKAVVLHENGKWEIKEEEDNGNESDDSSVPLRIHRDRAKGKEKAAVDVIVLDDD